MFDNSVLFWRFLVILREKAGTEVNIDPDQRSVSLIMIKLLLFHEYWFTRNNRLCSISNREVESN